MPTPTTNPAARPGPGPRHRSATMSARGVPPAAVAAIRSLVAVVAVGALVGLIHALTGADLTGIRPEYRPLVVAAIPVAVRVLEGIMDQLRGQAAQAGPLGGSPANPLDYAIHVDDVNNAHPLAIAHAGAAILSAAPAIAVDWLETSELHTLGQTVTGALSSESRPPIDATPSSPPVDDPIGAIVDRPPAHPAG